ncbi:MAG TPA: hypothetical protein VMB71_04400, partial [Acetobacteraceae bacterium]|nr:hypothetical protein [Acetobacteraceae bacterium]
KTIKTDNAYFQAQRTWRLPPAAHSADLAVSPDARDAALAALGEVHVCFGSTQTAACGAPGTK